MPTMTTGPGQRPAARLALEDGTIFLGRAFGACEAGSSAPGSPPTAAGEVVFNTAMTGYQEALTDPSYAGQILTMTAPMIGNYGITAEDVESARPQVAGFVIRELSRVVSNQRAVTDLSSWLAKAGVLGIEGIDTRALVRKLRTAGVMRGVISTDVSKSDAELVDSARSIASMAGQNLASCVSPTTPRQWSEGLGDWGHLDSNERDGIHGVAGRDTGAKLRVLAIDCGAKRNIYRHLVERGCEVDVRPYNLPAAEIRALKPDGLFISNGPGDPEAVEQTIAVLRAVAGEVPTFGICLGHQLLALALGAKTYKLKYGHRGANQPVRNVLTGRVEITSQNHGFCVDVDSLKTDEIEVTHVHLNDGTVAGFRHRTRPILAVQYHPEASPGPHDSAYLFDCFVQMMRTGRPADRESMVRAQDRRAAPAVC